MRKTPGLLTVTIALFALFVLLVGCGATDNSKETTPAESPENAPVASAGAQSTAFAETVTFRARVSELLMQTGWLERGKSREDIVEVTLPGRLIEHTMNLTPVDRTGASYETPVRAMAANHSAFQADDTDWILETFSQVDRPDIRQQLENLELRERNRTANARIESVQVWAEAELKGYRLVFVRYNGETERGGLAFTFAKTPEGWKRTNALRDDESFDVAFGAFRVAKGFDTGETGLFSPRSAGR